MAPVPRPIDEPAQRLARIDDGALFARYRSNRDPHDLERLVARYLPLARHLSRSYPAGDEREDLEQVAALALVKSIERFDPARGIAFTSFAVPTILGELKRYFRDLGWTVRVPRSLQELHKRIHVQTEEHIVEHGRWPTAAELADRCEATIEQVLEAREVSSAHRADSLDAPIRVADAQTTRYELVGGEDQEYRRVEDEIDLAGALERLPDLQRRILELRFSEDLTQREIADRVGVSQMQVSRLIRSAFAQLRQEHERPALPPTRHP
jgi:RNA polymerase sigma-B factor